MSLLEDMNSCVVSRIEMKLMTVIENTSMCGLYEW